ncbi:hypothetical protein [Luteibacter yeojuensis]
MLSPRPMRVVETLQDIEESIPNLLDTMEAHQGRGGLHYVGYMGRTVPW